MTELAAAKLDMLLVEPVTLLRRTVALTARSLGLANVHEAASNILAERLLKSQRFHGAVIAIDGAGAAPALELLDRVRSGNSISDAGMPIAVMADHCDAALLAALQARGVSRIILKPFRARALIDTITDLGNTSSGIRRS